MQVEPNIVEIEELKTLLGYSDERSVKKWCRQNQVPILKMGLKRYILSHYLTQLIENQLVIFAKANALTQDYFSSIGKIKQKQSEAKEVKEKKGAEKRHSEATLKFLKNIKSCVI